MQVKDIMTSLVFSIPVEEMVTAASEIMEWAHVRHVPVVDNLGRLKGIITHRDILAASVTSLAHLSTLENKRMLEIMPVKLAMRSPVQCVEMDTGIGAAIEIMRTRKLGCLPVLKDGLLAGIVTESDFTSLVANSSTALTVEQLMSTDLWTINAENNVLLIQEIMNWACIRHVPVVDHDERLLGIISHRDLLHACLSRIVARKRERNSAEDDFFLKNVSAVHITSTCVQTVTPSMLVTEAAKRMLEFKIGALPVVFDGKCVGILTRADLLGLVLSEFQNSYERAYSA